ncbi:MAG: STAS-like domain-containing protein [Treponema sp.]|nr:STAS-like domain-containing protein [Treponema sp.]
MEKTLAICGVSEKFRYQGPRYKRLGGTSGEEFRDEHLVPWLRGIRPGVRAAIDFAGTKVYGAGFLEECFGGAARASGQNKEKLAAARFLNIDPFWEGKIRAFIREAEPSA